jgi:pyruvate kinase
MLKAGMDVARVNFSHGSAETNFALLAKLRSAAAKEKKDVAVMQDLQGAKLRVGRLPDKGLELLDGSTVVLLAGASSAEDGLIPVPYVTLAKEVKRGDAVLLSDGLLELTVIAVEGRRILTKVEVGGNLISYRGLTVPNRALAIEGFTDKDKADLILGINNNVDMVALSFVRTADDVRQLRKRINRLCGDSIEPPQVIVKIEKREAIDNFDDILEEADAVMVARGDLGLETAFERVPVMQKELIAKCLVAGKPVVVATHMLSSMTLKPRPTRAEASDVANAVIDHADALMLSEETAMGRYPVRSVKTMADIIEATESSLDNLKPERDSKGVPTQLAVAAGAVELARQVRAAAILVTTRSGYSARAVARFRPEIPIMAVTDSVRVQKQLQLSWGARPIYVEGYTEPDKMVQRAIQIIKKDKRIDLSGQVVVVSGLKSGRSGWDPTVRVVKV